MHTRSKDVLLLFLSPSCAVCATLAPAIKPLVRQTREDLHWAIVTYGGRESARRFRRHHGLDHVLVAYAPKVRNQLRIGLTPYAFLIGRDGVVTSKGLINQMEHLESLLEARDQRSGLEESESTPQLLSGEPQS